MSSLAIPFDLRAAEPLTLGGILAWFGPPLYHPFLVGKPRYQTATPPQKKTKKKEKKKKERKTTPTTTIFFFFGFFVFCFVVTIPVIHLK
jgi:hypothetical protein